MEFQHLLRVRWALLLCFVALLCVACGSDTELRREARAHYLSLSAEEQQKWIEYIEMERQIAQFKKTHDLPSRILFWEGKEKKEERQRNQSELEWLQQQSSDLLRSAERTGVSLKDLQLATGEENPADMRARLYWFKKQRALQMNRITPLIVSILVVVLSFLGFYTLVRYRRWRWANAHRRSKRIRREQERIDREDTDTEAWLAEQRRNLDALDAFYGSKGDKKPKDSDDPSE
jgi:hypothetical protein